MRIDNPTYINAVTGLTATKRIRLGNTSVTSSVAAVDFTLPSQFNAFEIWANDINVDTGDVRLLSRFSEDNGATFLQGSSDYEWTNNATATAGGAAINSSTGDSFIRFGGTGANTGISTAAGGGGAFVISLHNMNSNSTMPPTIQGLVMNINLNDTVTAIRMHGQLLSSRYINAIRIALTSGNITKGLFNLYGYI